MDIPGGQLIVKFFKKKYREYTYSSDISCEVANSDGTFSLFKFEIFKNKATTFTISLNSIDQLIFNFSNNSQVQCTSSLVTSKKTKKLKPGKHIKFDVKVSTSGSTVPNISSIDPGVGIVGDRIKIVYTGDLNNSLLFFNHDGHLNLLLPTYPIDEPNTGYFIIPKEIEGLTGKVLYSNGNVMNKQTSTNQPLLKVLAIAY